MARRDKCKKGQPLTSGRYMTPWFRGSFMHVWTKAKPMDEGKEPRYEITMVFDEDEVDLSELRKLCGEVAQEKFKKTKGIRTPFRDGDEFDEEKYPQYAGKIIVKCDSKKAIGVFDHREDPITKPEENEDDPIYSGAYYRAVVYPFAYDQAGNKGVKLFINQLQKIEDGDFMGGGGGNNFTSSFGGGLADDDDDPMAF